MKKYSFSLFLTLFGVLFLTSCVDEDLVKKGVNIKEGIPVTLKLPFASDEPVKIETRAGENATYVDNLYILIFDQEGKRLAGEAGGGLVNLSPGSTNVSLTTTSGVRYIYGVANLQTSTMEVDKSTLDGTTTIDELKNLSLSLNQEGINESTGKFLMSGFCTTPGGDAYSLGEPSLCELIYKEDAATDEIKIQGTSVTPVLKLQRLQSKIKFNVKTGDDVKSFVLTSFSVINIPKYSPLYENKDLNPTSSSAWFNVEDNKTLDAGSRGFTFYMLENKQQNKENFPEGNPNDLYKYRSSSTYAPDRGTYVILKGAYEGPGNKYEDRELVEENQAVQASVEYKIYLGYVNDVLTDYNSLRNKDYTYTVTVNGVNSIIVEAELEKEDPSAGGDVYYETGGEIFNVDAHYASKVLRFKKSELAKDEAAANIKILVSSWKTIGFEDTDKEWLTFIGGGSIDGKTEYPVRYPGADKVMTADQFVENLQAIAKDATIADDEEFYFTCFINENYPMKGVNDESEWRSFVNRTTDRMAQIICRSKHWSNSQTIDAAYLIRQKPIYTFFNGGDQPWGVESFNETTDFYNNIEIGLPYGNPANQLKNDYDGRANMLTEVGTGGYWYEGGYAPARQEKPEYKDYVPSFNAAYAACMQRNRDENGDGIITGDEIKWYLPAIFQYTDMSIGANALPKTIQLYSDEDYEASGTVNNTNSWRFKHYVSNSGQKIYWGEEGGPYGEFGGDGGWNSAWQQVTNPYRYHIRCVRNLGPNSLENNMPPSPVGVSNGNLMDLSNMSPDALRPNRITNGELGVHSERDIASLPYKGSFQMATDLCKTKNYAFDPENGSYAMSDRNGYYYIRSDKDNVNYTKGKPDAPASLDDKTGPYKRKGSSKYLTWSGANRGNAMYSDNNGYYWERSDLFYKLKPRGTWDKTTPHTYIYVGKGKGIYSIAQEEATFDWSTVNIAVDKYGKSPCSEYSEEQDDSDIGTWRLPNMRELLLMISHDNSLKDKDLMSRTYYSFYLNDILVNNKSQNADGTLNGGYTIYSPMDQKSREGFAYSKVVYLIDPGNVGFYIRCVKDN